MEDTWAEPRTTEAGRTGAGEMMDPGLEVVEAAALTWELEATRDGEVPEDREVVEDREAGVEPRQPPTNKLLSKPGGEAEQGKVIPGFQVKRRSSI